MQEAWFNAAMVAWIPGTALGVLGGVLGAISGSFAQRGLHSKIIMGAWKAFAAIGVVLLLIGVYALVVGQPYGVWFTFLLPGVLVALIGLTLIPVIRRAYTQAELRKISARDA
ncbi:MAG: hypothetical protein IH600_05835 [Bacteroidetes bacterium]|nr:hypothetical protein [Bacteroidota bacterium]